MIVNYTSLIMNLPVFWLTSACVTVNEIIDLFSYFIKSFSQVFQTLNDYDLAYGLQLIQAVFDDLDLVSWP